MAQREQSGVDAGNEELSRGLEVMENAVRADGAGRVWLVEWELASCTCVCECVCMCLGTQSPSPGRTLAKVYKLPCLPSLGNDYIRAEQNTAPRTRSPGRGGITGFASTSPSPGGQRAAEDDRVSFRARLRNSATANTGSGRQRMTGRKHVSTFWLDGIRIVCTPSFTHTLGTLR